MSRTRSKQITLVIGKDAAVFVRGHDRFPMPLPFENNLLDIDALSALLSQKIKTRSGENVSIYLDASWVRYHILPWQKYLFAKQDWRALAQNHFREIYGDQASSWETRVCFQGFGKPVIASAIDRYLCQGLDSMANKLGWKLESIKPTFFHVADRYQREMRRGSAWLLMLEDDLVILFESQNGIWYRQDKALSSNEMSTSVIERLLKQASLKSASETKRTLFLFNATDNNVKTIPEFSDAKKLIVEWQITQAEASQ